MLIIDPKMWMMNDSTSIPDISSSFPCVSRFIFFSISRKATY